MIYFTGRCCFGWAGLCVRDPRRNKGGGGLVAGLGRAMDHSFAERPRLSRPPPAASKARLERKDREAGGGEAWRAASGAQLPLTSWRMTALRSPLCLSRRILFFSASAKPISERSESCDSQPWMADMSWMHASRLAPCFSSMCATRDASVKPSSKRVEPTSSAEETSAGADAAGAGGRGSGIFDSAAAAETAAQETAAEQAAAATAAAEEEAEAEAEERGHAAAHAAAGGGMG